MAENSGIAWTTHTFNPWRGCSKVSDGCRNCYADTMSARNPKTLGVWGPDGTRVVASEAQWRLPVKWNEQAQMSGTRPRVFCASLADVFGDWAGPMETPQGFQWWKRTEHNHEWTTSDHYKDTVALTMTDVRRRLFKLITATPNLDWLVLTKRPENVLRLTRAAIDPRGEPHGNEMGEPNGLDAARFGELFPNVWLGTSVEDQAAANVRIPQLLSIPAKVRFLSMEPLLEPVELIHRFDDGAHNNYLTGQFHNMKADFDDGTTGIVETNDANLPRISWVIVGGESGGLEATRPCHLEWVRSIVRQCQAAKVPVFVKQLGSVPVLDYYPDDPIADEAEWARDNERCVIHHYEGNAFLWDSRQGQPPPFSLRVLRMSDKGGNPEEWPEDLRIREFPGVAS